MSLEMAMDALYRKGREGREGREREVREKEIDGAVGCAEVGPVGTTRMDGSFEEF